MERGKIMWRARLRTKRNKIIVCAVSTAYLVEIGCVVWLAW